jgi:dethiobiotin synthetase
VSNIGQARIIFITGTDTGVGKTLLTGLLLHHLRQSGCHALAIKPFCSGGTADVDVLHALQGGELTRDEINPFYFAEPVAPLVAARKHHRSIQLLDVLNHIHQTIKLASIQHPVSRIGHLAFPSPRPSTLLIEGSGGLLVPLGEGFTVADLIKNLGCEVIVASRNRLGTINHTLLTVESLQVIGIKRLKIAIMDSSTPDPSTSSNPKILAELLDPVPVISIPFLGVNAMEVAALKRNATKCKKILARILG